MQLMNGWVANLRGDYLHLRLLIEYNGRMTFSTLIDVDTLAKNLHHPDWVILDCRFSLADTSLGRRSYLEGHIPGAIYAHLDEDLCSPVLPGKTGRHPLPEVEMLVDRFSHWGIDSTVQVVVYDDWPGAAGAVAARLWWSLRWLGHRAAAVLDGGWEAWLAGGMPVAAGMEHSRQVRDFQAAPHPELLATTADVEKMRLDANFKVFDSRAAERYRGQNETIDPVAGHVPGAWSAPFAGNMAPDGKFLPAPELRERFTALLDGVSPENSVFYCGSGVSAAHNLLALAHAGLGDARLYVGSWSEWITDPSRPVAAEQRY